MASVWHLQGTLGCEEFVLTADRWAVLVRNTVGCHIFLEQCPASCGEEIAWRGHSIRNPY